MSEFNISVKGGKSIRLSTSGKYCDRDIVVTSEGNTAEDYVSEYTVTPSRETKILETANKVMRKDVTVVAIPFSQVSNLVGGTTFHIAKE